MMTKVDFMLRVLYHKDEGESSKQSFHARSRQESGTQRAGVPALVASAVRQQG